MKKINGITLIALVITIVVLIILATVVINLSLGDNGIFNRARTAKEQYQNAEDFEKTQISKFTNDIQGNINSNRDNYEDRFAALEARISALEEENAVLRAKTTPALLYSGSAGSGTDIQLSDSIFNYSYLIVVINGYLDCTLRVRSHQDGTYWYQTGISTSAQSSNLVMSIGATFSKVSNGGKTLSLLRCGHSNISTTSNSHSHPWNELTVTQIYGIL